MPVFPPRSLLTRPRRRRAIDRRRAIGLEPLESRLALAALPVVQSVLPPSGGGTAAGGGQVTITGSNFDGVTEVRFGGTAAAILTKSATALTVTQPALLVGFHDVTVTTPSGTSAIVQADQYLVDPLTITITNNTGLPSTVPISVGIFAQVAYDTATGQPINRPLNATGTAVMSGQVGEVGGLTILAAGSGYAPTVVIAAPLSGKQASAAANGFDKKGGVTGFEVTKAGLGYGQIVTISAPPVGPAGAGTTAEAYADIDASGAITHFTITSNGSGYQTAFTVDGGTKTATGYATVSPQGQITGYTVTDAGAGYDSKTSPSVTFYGGGKGALATGVVTAGGTIQSLDITAPGSGYFYAPTISLAQGNGASVDVQVNTAAGIVQSMSATQGGSGYGPTVTVSGSGTGLAAGAVITNNTVASVVPLPGKSGQGYLPSLAFSAPGNGGQTATARVTALDGSGGIAAVTIDNPGSGYTTQPTLTLAGSGSGGLVAATGAASVAGVQIVNPGFGYVSKTPPGVVFTGGGNYPTPAVGTATVADGGVASIAVSKGGNYFSAPTVTIDPPPSGGYGLEWVGFNTAGQFAKASSLKTAAGNLPTFPLDFTKGPATIAMPQIFTQATRIVFGVNSPPVLPVQSDGTVSAPNMSNPTDLNHSVVYDFVEYTLNQSNILYIDTSSVDQFGFPMTMTIDPVDSAVPGGVGTLVSRGAVFGSPAQSAQGFAAYLASQGQTAVAAFGTLPTQQGTAQIGGNTYPYRIIAPQDLLQLGGAPTSLQTWFNAPLQTLYDATSRQIVLVVPNPNAGTSAGNSTNPLDADRANYFFTGTPLGQKNGIAFKGMVNGQEMTLTIPAYTSNATEDVFAAKGIFAPGPTDDTLLDEQHLKNNLLGNIKNQVASAVNRGIVNLTKTSSPASFANRLGMGVVAAAVAGGGSGYSLAPAVTFAPPPAGPNAATAQGVAVISGDTVTGVIITDPGNGYDDHGSLSFTFSPPQAAGTTATGGTVTIGLVDTTAWVGTQANGNADHLPFYAPGSVSNWYAGYFHSSVGGQQISRQNLAYAFPYDDQGNQSSTMSVANPKSVAVTLGPWGAVSPTSPSVSAIDTVPKQQGGQPTPTDAATVSWTVSFSEPVKGVTAQNFALAPSGFTPGTISSVTPNGTGEYSLTWTVTAGTGSGSGLLGLNLANGNGIVDSAGEPLSPAEFTGQVYSVRPNPVGPTATITIPGGAQNPTDAATVTFTVAFNSAVTGLSPANFLPVAKGGIAGATVTQVTPSSGSGTSFTVTVNTGTGSGTLALQLANSTGVTPAVTGLPLTSTAFYTIDKPLPTAPTVSSIALVPPSTTSASQVSWTVTFSEPVTGLSAANFALVPTGLGGTPAIQTVSPLPGTATATWTVTATTGNGSGTLGLKMTTSTNVHDGDDLAVTNVPFTGSVYTIDRTVPVVQSITRLDPSPTDLANVRWNVSFSEVVTGVAAGNFQLVASGLRGFGVTQVAPAEGGGSNWIITATTGSGSGTLALDMVNGSGITDPAGLAPTNFPVDGPAYVIQRGGATIVQAPIAFWATSARASSLTWPAGMRPFADADSVRVTATLAVAGGPGARAARSGRGVVVSGGGGELTFSGTAASLNAFFQRPGSITYTPAAGSLVPRTLTLQAQGSDGKGGSDTSALLIRSVKRLAPAPTVSAAALLGPTAAGRPVQITYGQLVQATGATQTTTRSVEFMLDAVQSGRLQIFDNGRWYPVVPFSSRRPAFVAAFRQPILAPGGMIRWIPADGATGTVAAFSVRTWDGWSFSPTAAQVRIALQS
ncbi:MAG: beta strand repeat-containing protein [Planctomycetia bacterium]